MRWWLAAISTLAISALSVALAPSDPAHQLRAQDRSPAAALAAMRLPEGFSAQLIAAEPLVKQPVAIEFDDRGRLWVIQYLQYPNPAELQRVQVDRYSRTRYDRVPPPPPHGPRGADRITILEDDDGDGRMDRSHDFVAGLNLATGLAFGHGGVFVLQVPYLLFYPDRNRDDVPDGEPQVLLSGFGMEDAHSVANSLTWGPDGWLYGCQGSTVTAHVRGLEFQQGVWRYHPVTQQFELFCEGGGNTWGLDFDRTGRLLYSTNFGGFLFVHGVQGAYYVKSFGKHGALHNPHAYGFFEHTPHKNFRGGHVTVGGIVYQGDSFPSRFRDTYIAADLLGHGVYWHHIRPRGSTLASSHGGELLTTTDSWFAPTDLTLGPDGAIYVADWHDARTAHPDPDAEWDRTNGRIYRLAATGTAPAPSIDFTKLSTDQLHTLHDHRSQWYVRRARQELTRRIANAAGALAPDEVRLREQLTSEALRHDDEVRALEALWTVRALHGFTEPLARQLLASKHPAIRSWTLRFLGDDQQASPELAHQLDEIAEQESSVDVLQQMAATAARLPATVALPMINANINRDDHGDDPFLPLLWWWAVEKHSVTGREEVLKRFIRPTLWKSRLGREVLLTRLIRRYVAEATIDGLNSAARLLRAAPDTTSRLTLWPHVLLGWQEYLSQKPAQNPLAMIQQHELRKLLIADWIDQPHDHSLLRLAIYWQHDDAIDQAIKEAFDDRTESSRRATLLGMLVSAKRPTLPRQALALFQQPQQQLNVRLAALQLVAQANEPDVAAPLTQTLIQLSTKADASQLTRAIAELLLSRRAWARELLLAVDQNKLPADAINIEQIRLVSLLEDEQLNRLVTRHWGRVHSATQEEKLAEVRRLNNDLRAAPGNPQLGRQLFQKHCATCHQLFGEGNKVGPDLTTANRQDRDYLLVSLVDPSSVIRKEYVSVIVQKTNGVKLTGLPIERSDSQLTLIDSRGAKQTVPLAEIEEQQDSPVSLMPADLYRQLSPDQLRNLFAYLQSKRE
ncbi:MAG: PVC-type heme-binding CxxCH protein [Planctomycetota bacterium]